MPPIPAEKQTPAQMKSVERVEAKRMEEARRRGLDVKVEPLVSGPFVPLLRSPEFMSSMVGVTEALETYTALPQKLIEMTIIMTSRQLTSQYTWNSHYPLALKAGLKQDAADAIAVGRRPEGMAEDEEIVYNFVAEVLQNRSVSDPTYSRIVTKFGEKGVVDTVGLIGYYSTLAMMLNVVRAPAQPQSKAPKLVPFPR
jgi:4-carboxymuconolactone decarboxylase